MAERLDSILFSDLVAKESQEDCKVTKGLLYRTLM